MDFFRDTADLFEPVGNDTFMDRKITVEYFGNSYERPPLKKGELGGFSGLSLMTLDVNQSVLSIAPVDK
jgi:hypothetical protein